MVINILKYIAAEQLNYEDNYYSKINKYKKEFPEWGEYTVEQYMKVVNKNNEIMDKHENIIQNVQQNITELNQEKTKEKIIKSGKSYSFMCILENINIYILLLICYKKALEDKFLIQNNKLNKHIETEIYKTAFDKEKQIESIFSESQLQSNYSNAFLELTNFLKMMKEQIQEQTILDINTMVYNVLLKQYQQQENQQFKEENQQQKTNQKKPTLNLKFFQVKKK